MDLAFNSACGFVTGSSHTQSNTPCQDFTTVATLDANTSLIVLSDGAGSAEHSDIGSKAICEACVECLKATPIWSLGDKSISKLVLTHIVTELTQISKSREISIKSLSGTLLVAIARKLDSKVEYKLIQIGDGVAAAFSEDGHTSFLDIIEPDNGEFANETYFVTATNAIARCRVHSSTAALGSSFILMSDGSAESLYDKSNNRLAPGCTQMAEWLVAHDSATVSNAIKSNLENFIATKTGDDCSVALMRSYPTASTHHAHTSRTNRIKLSKKQKQQRLAAKRKRKQLKRKKKSKVA